MSKAMNKLYRFHDDPHNQCNCKTCVLGRQLPPQMEGIKIAAYVATILNHYRVPLIEAIELLSQAYIARKNMAPGFEAMDATEELFDRIKGNKS